jgi:2-dehydro-3-deoxygalactonokinase
MSAAPHPVIGVDWGTSNVRAYLIDGAGTVHDRRAAPKGILAVEAGGFEAVLQELVGDWISSMPATPVILSGMIGSRQGWREAPYVETPAGIAEVGAKLLPLELASGKRAWIVPGLAQRDGGAPDVMRGEETQIFGALAHEARGRYLFCLPGTHSKWVETEDGRIIRFATHMTGEVFGLLTRHSILGRMMEGETADKDRFAAGLDRAADAGGLLHHLFSVRTRRLFDEIPATGARSYLSGILIGHEVSAALGAHKPEGTVALLGEPELAALYATALTRRGIATKTLAETSARGLWRIAGSLPAAGG